MIKSKSLFYFVLVLLLLSFECRYLISDPGIYDGKAKGGNYTPPSLFNTAYNSFSGIAQCIYVDEAGGYIYIGTGSGFNRMNTDLSGSISITLPNAAISLYAKGTTIYAGTSSGLYYFNSGDIANAGSWGSISELNGKNINAIYVNENTNTVYVSASLTGGTFYKLTNPITPSYVINPLSIDTFGDIDSLCGNSNGYIYIWDSSDFYIFYNSLTPLHTPVYPNINNIYSSGSYVYICVSTPALNEIYVSDNNGISFTTKGSTPQNFIYTSGYGGRIYCIGDGNGFYYSDNHGDNWSVQFEDSIPFSKIFATDKAVYLISGSTIYKYW